MAKGKLRHIRIEPTENAWNVHTEHEPDSDDMGKNGMASPSYYDKKPMTFTSAGAAVAHAKEHMAAHEEAHMKKRMPLHKAIGIR